MNYRRATLLAEKNLVGIGTETIEIVTRQPISRITLAWRVTKTIVGMTSYPHTDIVRIELVDGSDVLHSLDGGQNQAVCIYDRRCPTMNHGQHINGNAEYSVYGIDFGRFRHDQELALVPDKFMNLQLKISHDANNCDGGAASGNLEVWADLFDEKVISPVGFLMTKEHHKRAPPATGYWYVDMPTDFPLRKMFLQGYQKSKEPWNNVINCRLDEENEKRIPLDWELEDYYRIMKGVWAPVEETCVGNVTAPNSTFYTTPTDYYAMLWALCYGGADVGNYFPAFQPGGAFTVTAANSNQFGGMVHGWLPNHTWEFPFGDPKDLADWYDVTKLGSLRLRLNAGAGGAVGTVSAILQQLRYYK